MKVSGKNKLYIGFTIAIFLVMLVGGLSLSTFQKQTREGELVKHTYKVINELEEIQKLLVSMEAGRRGFRSTNERLFLESYYQGLDEIMPQVNSLITLTSDNPLQQSRAHAIKQSVNDLLAFWRNLGEDASQYTTAIILKINFAEKEKLDRIRDLFNVMAIEEQSLLLKRDRVNNKSIKLARNELLIGILLILIVVIALIIQILKEFRSARKAEQSLQQNYKELSKVNQQNAEQNWLLSGLAKVNNELQEHIELKELSNALLETIVGYLDLKAAAIYIFEEDTERLSMISSFALANKTKQEYELNEGFVGQVAVTKKPLIMQNIPARYATIEGGAVTVDPMFGVYVPLLYENELKGVIEVLCINNMGGKVVKFLELVSNNISAALHALKARSKVLALLEQLQEQKQEMENQQEELRQTNEELTVQAEVLQASEEELRVQEEELRQINDELIQKNLAVESAKEALSLKANELESTSRYKSEFLANMSHELRTPLNSVLILAKLLSDNKDHNLTEKQVAHAKIIYKSGSDLLQLINDILDLSKIEAGKVEVYLEETPVKTISNDIEQLFTVVADEKQIQFSIIIEENVPEKIKTDKQKLEQILKNLLSNAFKFTPEKGKVEMRFKSESIKGKKFVAIAVSDNGIGIPVDKQEGIFNAFQQADGATNRKYGGTGLGLSITRELVRLLNGKVSLQSRPNEGSTFTIYIPTDTADVQATPPTKTTTQVIVENKVKEQTKIPDDRNKLSRDDKVMLIIEDDPDFAFLIKDFAINHGFKAIVALSGDEGLFCAQKYRPSAIILDMGLPVYNGQTLLKLFKNSPELKHIPVHIISGADEERDSSGSALAFLKKPVAKKDLEKAFTLIEEYIQSSLKRVMILSENNVKDEGFRRMVSEKNYDVKFEVVENVDEAIAQFDKNKFDCLIADIGKDISKGIETLTSLNNALGSRKPPTIIYLDTDITTDDELAFRKVADVVVRKSSLSNNRLTDELELFLYKVQENNTLPDASLNSNISNDVTLQQRKVLLVDDDMRNIFALSAALEQEQMKVITANDGKEALELLQANKDVNIVLMDIMMPGMDGYEAIRAIRKTLMMTTLPIIALTAKAMSGDREKCIEAGASDYISKPVDIKKLVSLMRVWLS